MDTNKAVLEALQSLLTKDLALLEKDVSERTIAAKLASYLVPYFPKYNVDVEYNRHGLEIKTVKLPEPYRSKKSGRIYPDVVVHQRGHDRNNLLVIQLKKLTNREPRGYDRAVIHAMKRGFGYTYGLLIDLPTGSAAGQPAQLEWL